MDGVHLICTTAKVDRSFGDIPLVHGMPLFLVSVSKHYKNKILTACRGDLPMFSEVMFIFSTSDPTVMLPIVIIIFLKY